MAKNNYKGSIVNKIYEAVEKNPDMTVGEVLFSALHKNNLKGKHFFYATDSELYTALEKFIQIDDEENDEPLDEQAFSFWVEQRFIIKD